MLRQREIRDPIHGFIQRSDIEAKLIDTGVFQRLRGIKQLAMASLVYPGAVHTRFDHSIGVMHVASRLAMQLLDDPENRRIVGFASLLHDVGHGPFSHVSEVLLDRYYDSATVKPERKEKIHELLTCGIIEKDAEIGELISKHERQKITDLLMGKNVEAIARGIISGPLDADKQDYLLRDSYFCGVKYGVFDLERLIGALKVYSDQHDTLLAASADGIYAIEQFVMAKYHMWTQVYRHKVRMVSDAMIIRGLQLGIEKDQIEWLNQLFRYDGSEAFIKNYLSWDDARLTTELLHPQGEGWLATEFFRRLRDRRLFKVVFAKQLREFTDVRSRELLSKLDKEPEVAARMEQAIADYLTDQIGEAIQPTHVILKTFSIASVREQSRNSEGSILILDDGKPSKFEDRSTLFRSIDERESDQFIQVYAPVTFAGDLDKSKKMADFGESIHQILERIASEELEKRAPNKNGEREHNGAHA